MNERVKSLLAQAHLEAVDLKDTNWIVNRFAELIVKECAKESRLFVDKSLYSDEYEDCGTDCIPGDLEDHIKQHFGVEE